jgi:hypothetical protein
VRDRRPERCLEPFVQVEGGAEVVLRRGWPLKQYGRFVADAMIDALL